MNIKEFVKTFQKPERERLAEQAKTTEAYLYQLAGGHRLPSVELAKRLEKASNGLLTRQEMLPHVYE